MLVCNLIFQPIIRLIHTIVAVVEYILRAICRVVTELVNVLKQVLKYICNSVVRTVCGAVCSVICGICDFFCGIFGCDCGCRNVCNNVCKVVTDVVCGWTYVLETVLDFVTRLVCTYILQAIIKLLHIIEAFVTMVLTWVCTLVDLFIRWLLCWTYIAELPDRLLGSTRQRRFKVAPKVVPNREGYSDWFVFVNSPDAAGAVDQTLRYILSDEGRPLLPVAERSGFITYAEVQTKGDVITGKLRKGDDGGMVAGRPFMYYPEKVLEIGSHLLGDIFASSGTDNGTGTDFSENLFTYLPNVQAWLAGDNKLATNNYNLWNNKYTNSAANDYFGDQSIADMGVRVDTDATCNRPTNTFFHLVNGGIQLTPPSTSVAESLTCDAGQVLAFDDVNFLMVNKDGDANAITTYFVSKFQAADSHVGCNDLLGFTTTTFSSDSGAALFVSMRVLPYSADTNRMMARVVENISGNTSAVVRVAETYVHECGHQSGLLHDDELPDCHDDTALNISKVMAPGASVRRAFTRLQWCLVRTTWYVTSSGLTPFVQAAELPDSGTKPKRIPGGPTP